MRVCHNEKMEAETGVMLLEAKESAGSPKPGTGRKDAALEPSKGR